MGQRVTDTFARNAKLPEKGNRIYFDDQVKGFGLRVTAAGAKAFILDYRNRNRRQRRYTIGSYPDWSVSAAREEAKALKAIVDTGGDPMAELEADRNAKTVADLCTRFTEEHLPKLRAATASDYEWQIRMYILPALKHTAVAEVRYSDVDELHRKITRQGRPYVANRVVALLSKMFSLAIKWQWRADNPVKGIERNQEQKRNRYLSADELSRLTQTLAAFPDQQAANVIRMLMLTGARRGEVLSARWDQIDLANGVWTKPGSTTKQKTEHRVPLSAPARQLLSDIKTTLPGDAEFVFPGRFEGHRVEMKSAWRRICLDAGLVKKEGGKVKSTARMHDLRHTYASMLASSGLSLPIIGALLGHSQPATTQRYAHLFDDPLRQATERVGAIVTGSGKEADVVELKGRNNG